MDELVSQMTKAELRLMVEDVIDQKLVEFFGDPDEGMELRESVKRRLIRQRQIVADGEHGRELQDVIRELELE
jgi:hypothetical protein